MKNLTGIFTLFLSLIFVPIFYAQQSVVSAGDNVIGSGGSVSYSVGQPVYTTNMGSNVSIAQGMQQPYEISVLGIDEVPEISVFIAVFPNPTTDVVQLRIENYNIENLSYMLFDISGRLLASKKIKQNETSISFNSVCEANYLLSIMENNKTIKTFNIIKKQ